jgi:hypothetical protein
MKNIFLITIVVLFVTNSNQAFGQLQDFNAQRYRTDKNLMLGLGTWASMNIIGSGIGWATSNIEENKYFHQMNVMWNLVNLGLSVPGYIKAKKGDSGLNLYNTLEAQRITETVFLVNAGIDLAYIGSGLLLKSRAPIAENSNQFIGYGNSLMLQGGFLLLFDWIAYSIHRKHAKTKLAPILQKIEPSDLGIGIKYKLD